MLASTNLACKFPVGEAPDLQPIFTFIRITTVSLASKSVMLNVASSLDPEVNSGPVVLVLTKVTWLFPSPCVEESVDEFITAEIGTLSDTPDCPVVSKSNA